MRLNIYLVSQQACTGYDTFSDFVCVAPDEDTARKLVPAWYASYPTWPEYLNEPRENEDRAWVDGKLRLRKWPHAENKFVEEEDDSSNTVWASNLSDVKAQLIGRAAKHETKARIVLASFHAG